MRRLLVGTAAIAVALGWLQLASAFGLPVTASAGMLDRVFGAARETGPLGWALLLVGGTAFVAFYFLVVEQRAHGLVAPIAVAIGAWLLCGAVVMPLLGLLQGAPLPGAAPSDPMRATFFMLNLGPGAAVAALVAWLLFGAVLAAGATLEVGSKSFALALGGAALAGALALAVPSFAARGGSDRVVEGRMPALPAGPVFFSVLELPQPPGAVLGPHQHVPGFVVGVSGTATITFAGGNVVNVGPGDAFFTENNLLHAHENRAAIPLAITLSLLIIGLTIAVLLRRGHASAVALLTALLVVGTVATIDPLMNNWYFISVRPVAARGAPMPVPAGHRTYESDDLRGLASGAHLERFTSRRLSLGESVQVVGPAAIVLVEGQALVLSDGRQTRLSAQSGATIGGGAEARVESTSGSARVLVVQVLSAN